MNSSLRAISPLFHNIFNVSIASGVKLQIHFFLNSTNLIESRYGYLEVFHRVPWTSR